MVVQHGTDAKQLGPEWPLGAILDMAPTRLWNIKQNQEILTTHCKELQFDLTRHEDVKEESDEEDARASTSLPVQAPSCSGPDEEWVVSFQELHVPGLMMGCWDQSTWGGLAQIS